MLRRLFFQSLPLIFLLFFNYSLLALHFEKIFQGITFKDLIPVMLSFTNGLRRSFWSATQIF